MSSLADDSRWLDATDQADLVARGEVHPTELLDAAIERIERIDPQLNAVVIRWFLSAPTCRWRYGQPWRRVAPGVRPRMRVL